MFNPWQNCSPIKYSKNQTSRELWWELDLLPAGLHGDGTRWNIIFTRGDDVGESDHVLLNVSSSLLPADWATQLWRPLLCGMEKKKKHKSKMKLSFEKYIYTTSAVFPEYVKLVKKK